MEYFVNLAIEGKFPSGRDTSGWQEVSEKIFDEIVAKVYEKYKREDGII